ncbi:reverse transcriptase domain-containing protein [Paenibacillus alginolyticus]|nr:reverse transcriptase domain-containing protein [Paenibacillus alginolyticus]MEC0141786.1 reverse transcriptase domain-containing protein [Paenibacillus alginolyticus]
MPPIASLGLPPVMSGAKRRQLGSRPESDGASKLVTMGRPTVCVYWKATLGLAKKKAIYEQDFMECSFGFRPGRSQHDAIRALDQIIMKEPIRYVVDADIRGFFNHMDHEWMMKFLEHRIADPNLLRLIKKFLKAGIQEDGEFKPTDEGAPQGGLISPILSNIYLHYALDLWFETTVKRECVGRAEMVRYADDCAPRMHGA